jgi:hypothetical protein
VLATRLLVLAVDALAPPGYASQPILVALTIILLTAGLFAVTSCLMLALVLVDLVLERIDVPAKYLFDCFLSLFNVLFGVVAFRLELFALTGISTKSTVCQTDAVKFEAFIIFALASFALLLSFF